MFNYTLSMQSSCSIKMKTLILFVNKELSQRLSQYWCSLRGQLYLHNFSTDNSHLFLTMVSHSVYHPTVSYVPSNFIFLASVMESIVITPGPGIWKEITKLTCVRAISKSSLIAQSFCWFCHEAAHIKDSRLKGYSR